MSLFDNKNIQEQTNSLGNSFKNIGEYDYSK